MKIAHACVVAGLVVPCFAAADIKAYCSESCTVTVSVAPSGCGGGITVTPDPLVLELNKPAKIQWNITSPGWAFADSKGINVNRPDAEFDAGTRTASKTSFVHKYNNSKKAGYKYDVNLVSTTDPKVPVPCSVDPTILNY